MPELAEPVRKNRDQRREALARVVTNQIAGGAKVESQSDYHAVLVKPGLVIIGREKRFLASVDEWGAVGLELVPTTRFALIPSIKPGGGWRISRRGRLFLLVPISMIVLVTAAMVSLVGSMPIRDVKEYQGEGTDPCTTVYALRRDGFGYNSEILDDCFRDGTLRESDGFFP